jgi:hypothetical protein
MRSLTALTIAAFDFERVNAYAATARAANDQRSDVGRQRECSAQDRSTEIAHGSEW